MKPVSKTAYYCCGLRMDDAQSERPLCGDHLAQRFMDVEARSVYAAYHGDKRAARSNAVRHRLIDDFLRAALGRTPDLTIFAIGAGFETRPYRLSGGHWDRR